jgi:putative transposase
MRRFRKLSQAPRHCQYYLGWVPKYRFRISTGDVDIEVAGCIMTFCKQFKCKLMEINFQNDHVHLLVMIPPKISLSEFVGTLKGRAAIRVFNRFRHLKQKPYWGNHFWTKGYCADTVGLDEDKIRKYEKYQEAKERKAEHQQQNFF